MMKNKVRRLSFIELLPEAAHEDVSWAEQAFHSKRMMQKDIYSTLCERLATKSIEAPSFSSFHRWVMCLRQELPEIRSFPFMISDQTRSLLATALRSMADDLDGGELR